MSTHTPTSSQHLAAARDLLGDLGTGGDPQTKAAAAAAHATLVLAEQVAALRVLLVGNAVSQAEDGQPAAHQ